MTSSERQQKNYYRNEIYRNTVTSERHSDDAAAASRQLDKLYPETKTWSDVLIDSLCSIFLGDD